MSAENYSARIKVARERLNIGQRRAARLWGFGLSCLQHWERGRREPSGLYQQRLEQKLQEIEGNQARSDSRP